MGKRWRKRILSTGVKVRIWDLGNEVDFGVAGVAVDPRGLQQGVKQDYKAPDAVDPEIGRMSIPSLLSLPEPKRAEWLGAHVWPVEAKMLGAVASGIRDVDRRARFSTHVSGVTAVAPAMAVAFYTSMRDNGFLPDELGFSFYPTSRPRSLKSFKETATAVNRALGRPIFIAEFGYPSGMMTPPFQWNYPEPGYPLTPEGQAGFLRDLIGWAAKSSIVSGIRPWAPDFVAPGWAPMALFSRSGKTLSAMSALTAIREGLEKAKR